MGKSGHLGQPCFQQGCIIFRNVRAEIGKLGAIDLRQRQPSDARPSIDRDAIVERVGIAFNRGNLCLCRCKLQIEWQLQLACTGHVGAHFKIQAGLRSPQNDVFRSCDCEPRRPLKSASASQAHIGGRQTGNVEIEVDVVPFAFGLFENDPQKRIHIDHDGIVLARLGQGGKRPQVDDVFHPQRLFRGIIRQLHQRL